MFYKMKKDIKEKGIKFIFFLQNLDYPAVFCP